MNIVGVQLDIAWEDKDQNFDRVQALLETSEIAAGSLIVLPEMFATGFSMNVAGIAEPQNGPIHKFMAELAREHQSHVVGGVVTEGKNGLGRNEAVVFDATGTEIARYCKLHPFSFGNETDHYEAGNKIATFNWTECVVAPFICYDLRFPELYRILAVRGAQAFALPAAFTVPTGKAHWDILVRARAIENQAFVIAAGQVGLHPGDYESFGHSMIVDPWGRVLAQVESGDGVALADIDLAQEQRIRAELPSLANRKPRSYLWPAVAGVAA